MAAEDEVKIGTPGGADDAGGDDDEGGEAPDMAGMEAMMGGMGGGEGGAGGMDMAALMQMMGKGGGGGMGGMADMMGGKGGMGGMGGMGGKGGGGGKAPEDDAEKVAEKWVWNQKEDAVHVRFKLDPPVSGKKDVDVKFKATTLVVSIRGESIIDGKLGGKVEVDDCTWCFSPGKDELQIMLTKVEGKSEAWSDLLA